MATLIISAMGICCAYEFRSKCTFMRFCCGMVEILRDVQAELDEDEIMTNSGINPNVISNTSNVTPSPSSEPSIKKRTNSFTIPPHSTPTLTSSHSSIALNKMVIASLV